MQKPINMAALEEIMQLAKKRAAASAAATDTANNASDDNDDIISPRVREFFDRLSENNLKIVEVDEEELKITVKEKFDNPSKYDPDVVRMLVIARIVDDDIDYSFTYGGHVYGLWNGLMADGSVRSMAKVAEVYRKDINYAFEVIRDRTHEHERNKSHDDYIH